MIILPPWMASQSLALEGFDCVAGKDAGGGGGISGPYGSWKEGESI